MHVEHGTNPPTRPILKKREPIHLQSLTATTPLKPVRVNGSIASQGYADEEAGAWVADHMGQALSGMERHMCSMVDRGDAAIGDFFGS